MKYVKNKANSYLALLKNRYQPQIDILTDRIKPAKDYWKHLSEREQRIILIGAASIICLVFFSVISIAIDYRNSLRQSYNELARYKLEAEIISASYKSIEHNAPNDFSTVTSEKIKSDVKQITDSNDTEVLLADNILTIKINNTKFESVVLLLDQLRRTYAIFPDKLRITRLSQSGYVQFSATFNHVEPE